MLAAAVTKYIGRDTNVSSYPKGDVRRAMGRKVLSARVDSVCPGNAIVEWSRIGGGMPAIGTKRTPLDTKTMPAFGG
jgi:hypothetical protein